MGRQRVGAAASGPRLCQEREERRATPEKRRDASKYTRYRSGGASSEIFGFQEMMRNTTKGSSRLERCYLCVSYVVNVLVSHTWLGVVLAK